MKISYAITVCNELEEIIRLVDFLITRIESEDEIVIQFDENNVTKQVEDYLNVKASLHKSVSVCGFPLNKDFASYKNNLIKQCKGEFIFQIDADEIPNEYLLATLKTILTHNSVDVLFVPRVNTVKGLTDSHIQKWKWSVNEKGWVNFPDYQTRIFRNTKSVKWFGSVHERISGYSTFSFFPPQEEYSLYHPKDIDRQERQNSLYETI